MTMSPSSPRVPPLPDEERSDAARELLALLNRPGPLGTEIGPDMNVFTTLVRNEALFRRFLGMSGAVLAGVVAPRQRELLILAVAVRSACSYEWGHHVNLARSLGFSEEELHRIHDRSLEGWNPLEHCLLRAVDELYADFQISDATWDVLFAEYGEQGCIQVLMLVGLYQLLANTINSLGIMREEGVEDFPS
jgi:alkylhydroperoxidase family enzyme